VQVPAAGAVAAHPAPAPAGRPLEAEGGTVGAPTGRTRQRNGRWAGRSAGLVAAEHCGGLGGHYGVKPALFSANSEGTCPTCNGADVIYTDLVMMAGVATVCEGNGYQAGCGVRTEVVTGGSRPR